MKRIYQAAFTGVIAGLERLANSRNGNPRYRVVFADGQVYSTEPDAQIGYGITNPEFHDVPLYVYVTRGGHLWNLYPVSAADDEGQSGARPRKGRPA